MSDGITTTARPSSRHLAPVLFEFKFSAPLTTLTTTTISTSRPSGDGFRARCSGAWRPSAA